MTARSTFVVFAKELTDGLRDRRSLVAAFLYALFGPLVLGFALLAVARQADERGPFPLAVAGLEEAPSLAAFLTHQGATLSPAPADAESAVRRGELELVLRLGEGYAADFRAGKGARVELIYDSSRRSSAARLRRLQPALRAYEREVVDLRLLARGVNPEAAAPLRPREIDLATPAARAAVAIGILPMFLLMAAFVVSMNLAIDATAGERERGSLEALLVHPVPRSALAVGKWLAAAVLAALGVALTLAASRLVLASEKLQALDLPLALARGELLSLLGLLLPLALLAPALQMLVALFCRSFKEAQTYLSLLLFVPVLPGFFLSFGSREPAGWMDWLPLAGHQILASRVLRGEPLGPEAAGLAIATVALGGACVAATGWLLGRERIVLGR